MAINFWQTTKNIQKKSLNKLQEEEEGEFRDCVCVCVSDSRATAHHRTPRKKTAPFLGKNKEARFNSDRCLAAAVVKTSSSVQLKQPKAEHAKD